MFNVLFFVFLRDTELEAEQAASEKQKLEHQLANQELSASDVQRLHSEMRQLNATLDAIEKDKQDIDQAIWDEEKQIAKKKEHVRKRPTLSCLFVIVIIETWGRFHKAITCLQDKLSVLP